jgi:hypothetical protein
MTDHFLLPPRRGRIRRMITNRSAPSFAPVPPYSRMFRRGSLGSDLDGRSAEAKFIRAVEAELVAHIGGMPNIAQKLLIRRVSRALLRLETLDTKMSTGNWTEHDARLHGGLNSTVRLGLRELGIKPTVADKTPSLGAYLKTKSSEGAEPP